MNFVSASYHLQRFFVDLYIVKTNEINTGI